MPQRSSPKPRVFISHSAKETAARRILDQLTASLAASFEVLYDKDGLVAGDEWRRKLFNWMNRAHSAVVLLSKAALKSDWVKTEASVLAWRRTLDRGQTFKIIPVLLPGVKPDDLAKHGFGPMELPSAQLVRSGNAADIIRQVAGGLKHLARQTPAETPYEKLERGIAFHLKGIPAAELLNAARAMNVDVEDWQAEDDYALLLAREMLNRGLAAASKALLELEIFLDNRVRSSLIDLVAPVWVNLRAASLIPQIATRAAPAPRVLFVNGGDEYPDFTAGSFVRRACCRKPESCWPVLNVPNYGGEDDLGHFKQTIRDYLKIKVLRKEDAKETETNLVLRNRERDREPVFVALTPPAPDPQILAELRAEFPTLTFFVLTGSNPAGGMVSAGVDFLQPELQAGEEAEAYAEYITASGYHLTAP